MLNKKGFTLIELVGTVLLLSIIFVITVPRVNDFIATSREEAHNDSMEAIEKAISLYATSIDLVHEGEMPLTVTIRDGKYFYNFSGQAEQEGNILEINGKVPDGGKIVIQADKSYEYSIYNAGLNVCSKNDNTNYLTITAANALTEITDFSTENNKVINVGTLTLPNEVEVGEILLFEYIAEYDSAIYDIEQTNAGMYFSASNASNTINSKKMKLSGTGVYQVSNVHKVTESDLANKTYEVNFMVDNYTDGTLKISNPKITRQNKRIDEEGECE